jgi:hypothetical protein
MKETYEVEKIDDGKYRHIKREFLWDDDGYMILRTTITQKGEKPIVTDQIIKDQDQYALEQEAKELARNIPNWAKWNMAETVSYIENNVKDLASAKTVLVAMAKMIVALRNRVFSDIVLDK